MGAVDLGIRSQCLSCSSGTSGTLGLHHQRRLSWTFGQPPPSCCLPFACSVMLKVEQRIDTGQLKLRDEELYMKNVKEAANARAVLAAYHPLWLRLGMEVVTGQSVAGRLTIGW